MLPTRIFRTRWETPFEVMQDDLNRAMQRWWGDSSEGLAGSYPVDIREDADHVYVDAELPGFTRAQIEVTLENGLLSIQAQRQAAKNEGEQHLHERRFTRVARSFTLPNTVDETKVTATLENGVLHLTLNKREEVKPRKIEVK
ncbi:MAG: Hsp20/alpha crystallin family protein [Phycisphaeraceae bacterium]|nr:Hsp20/alpha crystallin family protein [Phycisphaeraceae bacterium]